MKLLTKYFFTFLLGILLSAPSLFAQKNEKVYNRGTSVLMLGYGIGNFWKSFLEQTINFPGVSYEVRAVGPVALVYEYGFHKRFSGGISLSYSSITGKYSGYGDSFTDRLNIFTVLGRVNYHALVNEHWDVYGGGGLGYVNARYDNSDSQTDNRTTPGSLGYTAQLGARYYIQKRWGVYAELGYVGGALAQAGLQVRFGKP